LLRCLTLLWAFGLLPVATAWSGTGDVFVLPPAGTKIKSGWSVEVDFRSIAANGYRPVRVKASLLPPGTTAKADRSLRIEVSTSSWYRHRTVTAGQFLDVPQGATSGNCTLLLPQEHEMHSIDLTFYEDGEQLDDLSGPLGITVWGGQTWSEARPGILVLHSDAPAANDRLIWSQNARTQISQGQKSELLPDIRPLAQISSENVQAVGYIDATHPSDPVLLDSLKSWSRMEMLPPRDLPKRWLEYSCYDMIFIRLSDLAKLANDDPEAWRAIRSWVTSGRVLCVLGVGEKFEQLAQLEQLAGMSPLDEAESRPRRGWTIPSPDAFRDRINGLRMANSGGPTAAPYMTILPNGTVVQGSTATPAAPTPPDSPSNLKPDDPQVLARSMFVWRGWGMGAVAAFSESNPFPGSAPKWHGVFNSIPSTYWMWYHRHGMSLRRTNMGVWNGWIPGIGKAPVVSFLGMITLFMVVIGPINYFWLRQRQRAYLMLVTVPCSAGLVTLLLLAYAVLADGLGTQVRLRSFSWLDQRSGQTVTWSRQTYYAGLAPTRGLLYPEDSTVFTLEPHPQISAQEGGYREVEWSEKGQQLKRGYLASRTMQQFIVVRSGQSDARLDIRPPRAGDTFPQVTNRLGSSVRGVLLCDQNRNLYWSEGGDAGATLTLAPIPLADARLKTSDLIRASPLEAPPGAEELDRYYSRRNYYYYNDQDSNQAPANVFSSVLETQLRNVMALESLPPRSFIAFVQQSPLVPVGVDEYSEVGSLHVLWGQW